MYLKAVNSNDAPAAYGPYSHGMIANDVVYITGQIPIDPKTGELVIGSAASQAHQVLANMDAIAKAAGTCIQNAIKINVYVVEMDDFDEVNAEYAKWFPVRKPARKCLGVKSLAKGAMVEMDAIVALTVEE